MLHLADLLAGIPLPPADVGDGPPRRIPIPACGQRDGDLVQELGADLPAGHLHVWGGPPGAGKTAFLLCLLHGAALRGRRVVYATYDLPPESLALRLLAMTAGVERTALPDPGGREAVCRLAPEDLRRAQVARAALARMPFDVLPARGFSARSLWDRLVRMPFRAEVLAVDYLQGVVRAPGTEMGAALRELTDMAEHLHVAVVCAVRAADSAGGGLEHPPCVGDVVGDDDDSARLPDRVGWIAPAKEPGSRRAQVLSNRYGPNAAVPLHLDEATGSLGRSE
jgi:hypothetical protein